ncbi:hypothetical protein PCANC_13113 [Puccinia coronata f. sp. avenae]|uniref:CxC1-like cysteine cluster associated with KDZ transposases domain-containing protein n=1 Tax=Puccinia coronata f. sp. avenae TaxID=200324 RepID=A0A2N5UUQ7_9BASI|nr:hypothetical protein PCANC_13113 [Puccinia coronata f. sp. avenae]
MDKDCSPDLAKDYSAHMHEYNGPTYWVDVKTALDEESNRTLAQIQLLYQRLKQNHKQNNWSNLFKSLFPVYTHLKRITNNWTSLDSLDNRSSEVCNCQDQNPVFRQVDLIDLLVLLSTPKPPSRPASLTFITFFGIYATLPPTPFQSLSIRLCSKNLNHPRRLGRNLSGSIEVYQMLLAKHLTAIQTVTSSCQKEVLAQQSCPACFGSSFPDPSQPPDTKDIFICLDGNFQHCHHEWASKNHLPLQTPDLFLDPDEICAANAYILSQEQAQKKTKEQVKVAVYQWKSLTLPENLARMAASEFLSNAAIRIKLGRAPPSESLTNSNSMAKRPGR